MTWGQHECPPWLDATQLRIERHREGQRDVVTVGGVRDDSCTRPIQSTYHPPRRRSRRLDLPHEPDVAELMARLRASGRLPREEEEA